MAHELTYYTEYPERNNYRKLFHNAFMELKEARRRVKVQQAKQNLQEEPPTIFRNPSHFGVFSSVRETILNQWNSYFHTLLDTGDESDSEDSVSPQVPIEVLPRVVNIGLISLFSLIKEVGTSNPEICRRALFSLLNILEGYKPEDLTKEPSEVLDRLFTMLLQLSAGSVPGPADLDDGRHISAVASSCLLSLAITRSHTTQLLAAIANQIMGEEALANQSIIVPKIMVTFQRLVQNYILGTSSFRYWLSTGVTEENRTFGFKVSVPAGFKRESKLIVHCLVSDGSFLYVHCSLGLMKIGTGYGGTIKACVYKHNAQTFRNVPNIYIVYHKAVKANVEALIAERAKNNLYARTADNAIWYVVDKRSLTAEVITLDWKNIYTKNINIFSDTHHIGLISTTEEDGLVLKLCELREVEGEEAAGRREVVLVRKVLLSLWQRSCYSLGGAEGPGPTLVEPEPAPDDEPMAVAAGQDFSLIRMASGKIFYNGKASALAFKTNWHHVGKWRQLLMGKGQRIAELAVGHEGQHAVLLTEEGQPLFSGLARRGEDGEPLKARRQPKPVRNKKFPKLDHEIIITAACNYGSSALISKKGHLYMFGKDTQHSDGTGLVKGLQHVVITKVALGKAHAVVVSRDGVVYTFGINNKGQCGRFSAQARQTKVCAVDMHKWKQDLCMICTQCLKCTGFLGKCQSQQAKLEPGQVCGCGEGDSGCEVCGTCRSCADQLCGPSTSKDNYGLHSSTDAFSRKGHRKGSSQAYSPGAGRMFADAKRTLEDAERDGEKESAHRVTCLPPAPVDLGGAKAVQVACGLHHTVLLASSGEVYTFGSNQHGQLGTGDMAPRTGVVRVRVPPCIQVAAGSNHTVLLTHNGEVFTMGCNNKGQLGRKAESLVPGPVVQLGSTNGCKAKWIGASADETFIKLDQALINSHILQTSLITGDRHSLFIIPQKAQDAYKQLLVNKKDGKSVFFNTNEHINFTKSLPCLDPSYDVMWQYDAEREYVNCYNLLIPNCINYNFCCIKFPTDDPETGSTDKDINILNEELALPKAERGFDTRDHVALHLLACLENIFVADKLNFIVFDDQTIENITDPKAATNEEYLFVNRFSDLGGGWGYTANNIEAIRFMVDGDIILGGFGLYGGRGEYIAKAKLFDIGFEGGDVEGDGELIAESEEIVYECPPKEVYKLFFDSPIKLTASRWYVAWAHISGPSSDSGNSGMRRLSSHGYTFTYKLSKKSTNGTDINAGQIPFLLFKKGTGNAMSSKINVDCEPPQYLSRNFANDITREGLQQLQNLLRWSWMQFRNNYKFLFTKSLKHRIFLLKDVEKQALVCVYTLRLIREYLTWVYPLRVKRAVESGSEELILGINDMKYVVISILEQNNPPVSPNCVNNQQSLLAERFMDRILEEAHYTFESLFHIFFPTSTMKWRLLCQLLAGVQDGVCRSKELLLSAALASLCSHTSLKYVFPFTHQFEHQTPFYIKKYPLLAEKMHSLSEMAGMEKDLKLQMKDAVNILLDLAMAPVMEFLIVGRALDAARSATRTLVVKHSCKLLTHILAELTYLTVNTEDAEDSAHCLYFCTPSRYSHFNPVSTWQTSKGYPDAICFKVDRPGVALVGVTVYAGVGDLNYELEILCDNISSGKTFPQWTSLEFTKGICNAHLNDIVELKFIRPVPIKTHLRYAVRLWNLGTPTKNGDQGVPSVKGPDGTVFTFTRCGLSLNGTNLTQGQIPSLLYIKSKENFSAILSSAEEEVKITHHDVLKVGSQILRRSTHLLQDVRNALVSNQRQISSIENSPCFTTLIPLTLAYLSQLSDPESCVETLKLLNEILPHVAALNIIEKNVTPETTQSNWNTTTHHYVKVESEHPYKPACIVNQRVTFPSTVSWMVLEMDPRSGTAQPEDSLTIFMKQETKYVPLTPDRDNFVIFHNSKLSCRYAEICADSEFVGDGAKHSPSGSLFQPLLHKMSNVKAEWPQKSIIIPGNQLVFSMETATDYIKDDNANRYGFKCLVIGYQDFPKASPCHDTIFSRLEMEVSYIAGKCAATLINPNISTFTGLLDASAGRVLTLEEEETENLSAGMQNPILDEKNSGILSRGLALAHAPTIQQALSGHIAYRYGSKKQQFLQDFTRGAGESAGARLARWLQPEPHVRAERCRLLLPDREARCGQVLTLSLLLRDQHGRPVRCAGLPVELSAHLLAAPPQVDLGAPPYTDLHNYSLEELRLATPCVNRPRDILKEKHHNGDKIVASWVPKNPGLYSLTGIIDGYPMTETLSVVVAEALEGAAPSAAAPNQAEDSPPNNTRMFVDEDSAGLRVRAFPSLQSEQVGLIPTGCAITFDDVVLNGDGVWVRLSAESAGRQCGGGGAEEGAWSLQYNTHTGRSLLLPEEGPTCVREPRPAPPRPAVFRVVRAASVRCASKAHATVLGVLKYGDIVGIQQTYSNMTETWAQLDAATVDQYELVSLTGECWITRAALETIVDENSPNNLGSQDNSEQASQGKNQKSKNVVNSPAKDSSNTSRGCIPKTDQKKKNRNGNAVAGPSHKNEVLESGKNTFKRKRLNAAESQLNTQPSVIPQSTAWTYTDRLEEETSSITMRESPIEESYPLQDIACALEPSFPVVDRPDTTEDSPVVPPGISPSKAESMRAVFAAFMWHEGIVHDAMTCASYLKFHPNLPKTGSQVVARTQPQYTSIPQRHSVEVSNAGNYLNIQQSTLESLTRSASRARSKRGSTVAGDMIREEEAEGGREIICVLPAAFRILVGIWEALAMAQTVEEPIKPEDKPNMSKLSDAEAKSDNDEKEFDSMESIGELLRRTEYHEHDGYPFGREDGAPHLAHTRLSTLAGSSIVEGFNRAIFVRRDNFGIAVNEVFRNCEKHICELCAELVELPVSLHMIHEHGGCGRNANGMGYNYTGLYIRGWQGQCGVAGEGYMGPGYIFCEWCREKCMKNKGTSPVKTDAPADPAETASGRQQNYPFTPLLGKHHAILKRNALFLLELESAAVEEDRKSVTSLQGVPPWRPVPPFTALQLLQPEQAELVAASNDFFSDYSPEGGAEAVGARVPRSASMGQDGSQPLRLCDGNSAQRSRDRANGDTIAGSSSLLLNPSAALLGLAGLSREEVSSVSPVTVSTDSLLARPVVGLLLLDRDINVLKKKMIDSVRVAALRKYGLEAFNWMLHSVTQPTCLHDLMWWFNSAMEQYKPSTTQDENPVQENMSEDEMLQRSEQLAGASLREGVRGALHDLLQAVSHLMPALPPASPVALQAVRCWALPYSAKDHLFLHRSQIFNNISRVLSHTEEEVTEDMVASRQDPSISGTNDASDASENIEIRVSPDVTVWCDVSVSSRAALVGALTDGSTESFWESGDEERGRSKWLQVTCPVGVSPVSIHLHIDNTRDIGSKIFMVTFTYGYNAEDLIHLEDIELSPQSSGWIMRCLPYCNVRNSHPMIIRCDIRGPDNSVRVRQVRLLGLPALDAARRVLPAHVTLQKYTEMETLRVFRLITSQVFGKLLADNCKSSNPSVDEQTDNNLKEYMVGILFSRRKLNTLQKQVMAHIVNAVSSEAARAREGWEGGGGARAEGWEGGGGLRAEEPESRPQEDVDLNTTMQFDEYIFEMLSMVLALSGSSLGRAYLAEHLFLIRDLLTLLHTGSPRVQRQVISVLRRMIDEVTPQRMTIALTSGKTATPNVTFIDHLVSCISKALTAQVKSRASGAGGSAPATTMAASLAGQAAVPWFLHGTMSRGHAELVIRLLLDMIQGKMSAAWTQTATSAIAHNIFALTTIKEEERTVAECLVSPILWRALGSLCVINEEQVERLSQRGWQDMVSGEGRLKQKNEVSRPLCNNHDDGETTAIMECQQCGAMCQECDRFLHLSRLTRNHQRTVVKEEESAIRIDLHEGCGRVKLFWLLALVDQRSLKALAELRVACAPEGPPAPAPCTGVCRFCGARSSVGLLAIGNVCAERECQEHGLGACVRVLRCGHLCGGYLGEKRCLPCLHGCAGSRPPSPQLQDEAAACPAPPRPPLRQDAEDMCMVCFTDPLAAAPSIQLACGHVFHLHCTKKVLQNKWIGPRITFAFSQCPICKEDIYHLILEDILKPIRDLQQEVKRKALTRLEYEGLHEAAVITTRYQNKPCDYAMDRYAYYVCFKCKKAYYGGEARCEADGPSEYDPQELVCGGCSDVARARSCRKHGTDFLEYKCRFCCTVAVFFCLGDTHFCNGCHDEFQRIRKIPRHLLPQCPAGPKGTQLEGSLEDCPLRVKHPPTGTEFALGCGVCRNSTMF